MKIFRYEQEITTELMALLLTADPDRNAILSYLSDAIVLVGQDSGKFVGIAAIAGGGEVFELKNIAVSAAYQGTGNCQKDD